MEIEKKNTNNVMRSPEPQHRKKICCGHCGSGAVCTIDRPTRPLRHHGHGEGDAAAQSTLMRYCRQRALNGPLPLPEDREIPQAQEPLVPSENGSGRAALVSAV